MSTHVLLMNPLMAEIADTLAERYTVHRYFEADDPERLLADHGGSIRGLVAGGHIGAPSALVERLPALEIVAINGVGYDKVDLELVRERGIRVSNTPDVLTADVADLAIGLALAITRRTVEGDRFVRAGNWRGGELPLARQFSALRFGILGLGRIGQAIAARLAGFGVQIAYVDLVEHPAPHYHRAGSLHELAAASDVLIVAAAANAATAKLVDRAILEALGPEGVLINVARGSIVDEDALVAALADGRLGGAALDVFADEPNVPEALLKMSNVVLTPHVASATIDTRRAMGQLVLANLEAHFAGRALPTPVV